MIKKERHHFPRKQANTTKEHLSISGNRQSFNRVSYFPRVLSKGYFLAVNLILPVYLRLQQNYSFSQLRLHYLDHLKLLGKNTHQNTLLTEQLAVAAFANLLVHTE